VKWTLCNIPALQLALGPGIKSSSGRGQAITKVIDSSERGRCGSVLARLRLDYPLLKPLFEPMLLLHYFALIFYAASNGFASDALWQDR
jgi:hypothetical protein